MKQPKDLVLLTIDIIKLNQGIVSISMSNEVPLLIILGLDKIHLQILGNRRAKCVQKVPSEITK